MSSHRLKQEDTAVLAYHIAKGGDEAVQEENAKQRVLEQVPGYNLSSGPAARLLMRTKGSHKQYRDADENKAHNADDTMYALL